MNDSLNFVLVQIWGLLVRFIPKLSDLPRWLIPWTNILLAFLIRVATPANANAAGADSLVAAAVGDPHVSWWHKLIVSVVQGLLNSAFYDKLLKAPVVSRFGTTKEKKATHLGTAALIVGLGLMLCAAPSAMAQSRDAKTGRYVAAWNSPSRIKLAVGGGASTTQYVFGKTEFYQSWVAVQGDYSISNHLALRLRGTRELVPVKRDVGRAEAGLWLTF